MPYRLPFELGLSTARPSGVGDPLKGRLQPGGLSALWGGFLVVAILAFGLTTGSAEDLKIKELTLGLGGKIKVAFQELATADYYVLMRGGTVASVDTAIDLVMKGNGILEDATAPSTRAASFYRVVGWSLTAPGDSDHDGIDDIYELNHPDVLNPLDRQDAMLDPDHDGRPNLWEYRQHTDLLKADWGTDSPISSDLALKPDGTLWNLFPVSQRGGDTRFRTVGSGSAIALDGSLWGWGPLYYLSYPLESSVDLSGGPIGTDHDWAAVARGYDNLLALKKEGSLWAMGPNSDNRLGLGVDEFGDYAHAAGVPLQVGKDKDWVFISVGYLRSLAIKSDGSLWRWGHWGNVLTAPTRVGTDKDWIAVSYSSAPTLGIKRDGTLWGWGIDGGNPEDPLSAPPSRLGNESNWVVVSATATVAALRADGSAWLWNSESRSLEAFSTLSPWVAVSGTITPYGLYSKVGIDPSGSLWAWSALRAFFPGSYGVSEASAPTRVGADSAWDETSGTMALKKDGSAWVWGANQFFDWDENATTGFNGPGRIESALPWKSIAMGAYHALGTKSDGSLWAWGWNSDWQLGYQSATLPLQPRRVGGDSGWKKVSGGGFHSVALKEDGTLWAWGRNLSFEAAGAPGKAYILQPSQISDSSEWVDISAGANHSLALRSDGTLWGWGYNSARQLGLANPAVVQTPTQIGSGSDWGSIAAGQFFSIALKRDGSLWFLGGSAAPKHVGARTDWKTVSAGYMVALTRQDGSGWVYSTYKANEHWYQSGLVSLSESDLIPVASDQPWSSLTAGKTFHFVGVKADRTLWVWGDNEFGAAARPVSWLPVTAPGAQGYGWPYALH